MKTHPGTLLSIAGVVLLLIGLAVQANAVILVGLVAAIAGAALGGARRGHHE